MAVEWVHIKSGRKWKASNKPDRKATLVLEIKCTDKLDGANVAAAACPEIDSPLGPADPGVLCESVDVDEKERTADGGVIYTATVEFSSDSNKDKDDKSNDPDPTERPAILRLSYGGEEETIYQQIDAEPTAETSVGDDADVLWAPCWANSIANSNGEPFPEGLRETVRESVYTLEKNLATADWVELADVFDEFIWSVNSADFSIVYRGVQKRFKAGTVLLADASSEPEFENGIAYERVTLGLRVRPDGWLRKVLDQGLNFRKGTDPDWSKPAKPITDPNGDPIRQPALLNGRGQPVVPGDKPVFLKFRTKHSRDFSQIPIQEIQ